MTLGLLLVGGAAVTPAEAQPLRRCPDAERVRGVTFEGTPRFTGTTLAAAIVTQGESAWSRLLRRNRAACLDTVEVARDALRLAVLHRQAGWFQAAVTPRIDRSPGGVRIAFAIEPGRRAVVEQVRVDGLPRPAARERPYEAPLLALTGRPFDRLHVDSVAEAVTTRLRDAGHARAARPVVDARIDTATATVALAFRYDPGPRMTVGAVQVTVRGVGARPPTIDTADVLGLVRVRAGQRFSARRLLDAQRDLYRSEAFGLVLLDTVTAAPTAGDSVIDLRLAVAQARTRSARVGVGWATQDCVRLQGRLTDRGFLGPGRRAELSARASKLGVGDPLGGAPALCSNALRVDPFSERLNYYVGATLADARLFRWPVSPTVSVYSERRGEPFAYLRETPVGMLAELTHATASGNVYVGGFQYENGRTVTDPVVACSRFGQCRPEDFVLGLFGRGVSVVSLAVTRDRTSDPLDPQRGTRVSAEARAGETFSTLASSLRFYRGSAEVATHTRAVGGVVAVRAQLAHVWAPGAQLVDGSPLIPQQERLFAGGQSSVRGFQQNLLGSLVYVVDASQVEEFEVAGEPRYQVRPGAAFERAVPRGGTALAVANVEYRRRLQVLDGALQVAAFVDVGDVWEAATDRFAARDLRATPGLGVRVATPLGPFRLDVGYLPYPPRPGRALFLREGTPDDPDGGIYCASPGNLVDPRDPAGIGRCPESYSPSRGRGVLSRLVFHFGLGQAF